MGTGILKMGAKVICFCLLATVLLGDRAWICDTLALRSFHHMAGYGWIMIFMLDLGHGYGNGVGRFFIMSALHPFRRLSVVAWLSRLGCFRATNGDIRMIEYLSCSRHVLMDYDAGSSLGGQNFLAEYLLLSYPSRFLNCDETLTVITVANQPRRL
jgi:hypothetical protein